jgi:hypothetical protein
MAFSSRASFPVVGSRSMFFPLDQGSFMMSGSIDINSHLMSRWGEASGSPFDYALYSVA